MAIYSIVLLMTGEIVTRNMYSKAIANKKRNCCTLLDLFHQYNPSEMDNPLPDVTAPDTALIFAVTSHNTHDTSDDLNDCWCTIQQLHTPFYNSNTISH